MDIVAIFSSPEAWISLITLIFLEIVLGVDNIVFIVITTNRLQKDHQALGRKLGLAGALVSRILFLCFASFLVSMTKPLFEINLGFYVHGLSLRDIVLFLGGAYLIYKGIAELREMFNHAGMEEDEDGSSEGSARKLIGLPQAVATIMVMDIVFSIDSVITAVGLANQLIIMILAVMTAVILMMLFIDQISRFINSNPEMTILALSFIAVIGLLLVLDSLGLNSGVEVMDMHAEKLMVYFSMLFAFIMTMLQIRYKARAKKNIEQ